MSLPPLAKQDSSSYAFLATGVKPPVEVRTSLSREVSYSSGGEAPELPNLPSSRNHVELSPASAALAPSRSQAGHAMPPVPRTSGSSLHPRTSPPHPAGLQRPPSLTKLAEADVEDAECPNIRHNSAELHANGRRKLQPSKSTPPLPMHLRSQRSLRVMNPAYKSKYDPELVILLRDFYNDLRQHGSSANMLMEGFRLAVQKYNIIVDDGADISYESIFGNPDHPISFRKMLRRLFANAAERDLDHMTQLAYPKAEPKVVRVLSPQEKEEYTMLFRLFDVDESNTLTMREIKNGLRTSTVFPDLPQFLSFFEPEVLEKGITLDEFLEGMRLAISWAVEL
eukprot:TRINITY_DN9815_c0_g1_i2.p1 TRINITY_DN9815_c0_g1~~TRINITY_DN9815_c0_g1_i2.p1  ORF type:complete len:398 (-),score=80.68 TRINITY_DN9815_c0_g1_i2:193-1209(-)